MKSAFAGGTVILLFTGLIVVVAVCAAVADAQMVGKVARVGYLSLGPDAGEFRVRLAALRDGLRTLGYIEGKDLLIEERHANGRLERLSALAEEILATRPDVVVAVGSAATARRLTTTVPIVFVAEPDPVGTGLVASLARPGANLTGLSDAHTDLVPKRLELLREVAPQAARLGFLLNPGTHYALPQLAAAQAAARTLGLAVVPVEVSQPGPTELERAFVALVRQRADALAVVGDPTLGLHRRRIAELAVRHRLPTIGTVRAWAEDGLLISYGADFPDLFRRAAVFVDRILKGTRPGDLPVEEPTKFDVVINLRTAAALGVVISPPLLLRATDVVR
jgi:putative ABC transport system substrate-binding protein